MKKMLSVLVGFVMLASLAACGGKGASPAISDADTVSSEAPTSDVIASVSAQDNEDPVSPNFPIVTFGRDYYSSASAPMEWYVLDESAGASLLLSKHANRNTIKTDLGYNGYTGFGNHQGYVENAVWHGSDPQFLLNRDIAWKRIHFTNDEMEKIVVPIDDDPVGELGYNTFAPSSGPWQRDPTFKGIASMGDQIFFLNVTQVFKYFGPPEGMSDAEFEDWVTRFMEGTAGSPPDGNFAPLEADARRIATDSKRDEPIDWYLMDPHSSINSHVGVREDGSIGSVSVTNSAWRVAMWVYL